MTTEKKPKTNSLHAKTKVKPSSLLNWKMLQAQTQIDAEKSKVASYSAFEYDKLIPKVISVTTELNLRVVPHFKMTFTNDNKPVVSCEVVIINLDVIFDKDDEGRQKVFESENHGTYSVVGDLSRNPKIECGQLYTYAYKNALLKIFNINEGNSDPDIQAIQKLQNNNGLNINDNAIPNL